MGRRVTATLVHRRRPTWIRTVIYTALAAWVCWLFVGQPVTRKVQQARVRKQPEAHLVAIELGDSDAGEREGYRAYFHYELVPITLRMSGADGQPIANVRPTVRIFEGDLLVKDAGGRPEVPLRYDKAAAAWTGYWAMPLGAHPGVYTARCTVGIPARYFPEGYDWSRHRQAPAERQPKDARLLTRPSAPLSATGGGASAYRPPPDELVAVTVGRDFLVTSREPELPSELKGFGAVSWEALSGDPLHVTTRLPDGRASDWTAAFAWLDVFAADALWYSGYATDARLGPLPAGSPWLAPNVAAIEPVAAEATKRGIKLGVYILAYRMDGPPALLPYDSKLSKGLISAPSIYDESRIADLAAAVMDLDADPRVAMIGFDYYRDMGDTVPAFDGVDEFVDRLRPATPADWDQRTPEQRRAWLKGECAKWNSPRPTTWLLWNWWRAHRMAEVMREIRARSRSSKPIWVFTLSWKHGIEHGQDPCMLLDAGASMIAPMLYQVGSVRQFEAMVSEDEKGSWKAYAGDLGLSLVPGNQIDFYWHQEMLDPPAPQEFYRRIRRAFDACSGVRPPVGVFCHDLQRTMVSGSLGPYSPAEWALAGAAAMTDVRRAWKRVPVEVSVRLEEGGEVRPGGVPAGVVRVRNTSDRTLRDVSVQIFGTAGVRPDHASVPPPRDIAPGAEQDFPVVARVTGSGGGRRGRFMLAARVHWTTPGFFPSATAFRYVTVRE